RRRGGHRCAPGRCPRRSGGGHQYHSAYSLGVGPLDFLTQALFVFGADTVWIFLKQREDVLDGPMPAFELIDHALEQCRAALIVALANAALADVLEQVRGQGRFVVDGRSSHGRGRCDPRKRRQELVRVPQPAGLLDDPRRFDGDASARPLLGGRKIRSSGDAIGLRYDTGVLVGAGICPHSLADLLGLLGGDSAREQVPVMEVPGRGLDHKAGPDRDVAALALIGVAVGDEPEYPAVSSTPPRWLPRKSARTVRASM